MSKIRTLVHLICHNRKKLNVAIAGNFSCSKISHLISDKAYLKYMYRAHLGKKLDLKNPKTFNEKLQWLKLYNRNPRYVDLVDKYEVKRIVAEEIGEEHIIPTLGVWERFEDIDFDTLPNQFVLKCTHDSGSVVICRDKSTFDMEKAREKLARKLKSNLFWHGREWPYKNVKPRILAEKYMEDKSLGELRDYKFFCFGGKVKCFKIDYDRFLEHRANYYRPDCGLLRFGEAVCPPDFERKISFPDSLEKMVELAEKLSCGQPFLRVDFYDVNGQLYFGELTFFPASGFGPFVPEEWDLTLGEWIDLPESKKE